MRQAICDSQPLPVLCQHPLRQRGQVVLGRARLLLGPVRDPRGCARLHLHSRLVAQPRAVPAPAAGALRRVPPRPAAAEKGKGGRPDPHRRLQRGDADNDNVLGPHQAPPRAAAPPTSKSFATPTTSAASRRTFGRTTPRSSASTIRRPASGG
ncbi:hypothetical protein L7F22_048755 [Adiantum nelumboides]|nr:hypothetical protein [Adiantum nelumboides]